MIDLQPDLREAARAIELIVYCNPFSPQRLQAERTALGEDFRASGMAWSKSPFDDESRPNVAATRALAESIIDAIHPQLERGVRLSAADSRLYESVVIYAIYYRLHAMLRAFRSGDAKATPAEIHRKLSRDLAALLLDHDLPGVEPTDPAHLLACFDQIVRAFDQIYLTISGTSAAAGRLRAAVWESIFTHDMRRYRRLLYDKTGDYTTLITGASGTGKELVARAIGTSRYIPFDEKKKAFVQGTEDAFVPVNLAALSPTLVESELFGHRRGAFTGATEDRKGFLETCPALGSVFLDEIGELDASIQVKLLRVLQERMFQRLGETRTVAFHGKIIAATNRDLGAEIERGTFRRDLYYRLCSDVITTPTLREQIEESPDELATLVRHVAQRLLPDDAETLTDQSMACIRKNLGPGYDWPGNYRELEQCVRNVLVRGEYRPMRVLQDDSANWLAAVEAGTLSADELLDAYAHQVYCQQGTFERAAVVLKLDRRTVTARVRSQRSR